VRAGLDAGETARRANRIEEGGIALSPLMVSLAQALADRSDETGLVSGQLAPCPPYPDSDQAFYRLTCTEFAGPRCSPSGCNRPPHILDLARLLWYWGLMNRSVRIVNCKHMTRFGWAVEGVAR
jgi:hypothetical protein